MGNIHETQLNAGLQENDIADVLDHLAWEGYVFVNDKGIIKYINQVFAFYLGYTVDQLIGENIKNTNIEPGLQKTLISQKTDLLALLPNPKGIVSRQPVYKDGKFIGVWGHYISIDPRDVRKDIFGEKYLELVSHLETRSIMVTLNQLILELNSYKEEFEKANNSSLGVDIIKGNSSIIQELKEKVLMIADSPSSVLITGESGTGKELFAQAIHYHGNRSKHPFVKINCAAIPENLMESEFFGYVEGAFTGAKKTGKIGKFEMADKGIIFLDEIGDMPLSIQAKLLRVLQEKEIERVGDTKTIPIDVRVISATNKDLRLLVREGTFREDLYYRLNVIHLEIPPLRERREDIPVIANHIVNQLNSKLNHSITCISSDAMELLLGYNWPGNIRELINVLESTMNFCQTSVIQSEAFPYRLQSDITPIQSNKNRNLKEVLDHVEKREITQVLEQCKGDRKASASMLGVSRTTLYRMMKKHNLL